MKINENQVMLLELLRSELMALLRKEEPINKPELISLLEQVKGITETIVCNDEKTSMLCGSLQESIAIARKWVEEEDLHLALRSAVTAISFFLMNKEAFK